MSPSSRTSQSPNDAATEHLDNDSSNEESALPRRSFTLWFHDQPPPTPRLVLFSPVVVPATKTPRPAHLATTDPYETFGKALAINHPCVSHVPYHVNAGFGEIHSTFVQHATAIVIIVCEPCVGDAKDSIARQLVFTATVRAIFAAVVGARATADSSEEEEASPHVPIALVRSVSDAFRVESDRITTLGNSGGFAEEEIEDIPPYQDDMAVQLADAVLNRLFKSKDNADERGGECSREGNVHARTLFCGLSTPFAE